ncbi:hypothetical protein LIER_35766 [Lithospermum erythrorhizon]|uniref:Uncharacterized protein n=1 Tax=Lithospermum erythrorhizon TaxID=34254 RepID=A0AAV3NWE3_LITER
MAGLIQGPMDQIVNSVMDQLKERLPHLGGEPLTVSSSVREETYMHTPQSGRTTSPCRDSRATMRLRFLGQRLRQRMRHSPLLVGNQERNYACGHEAPISYQVHKEDGPRGTHHGISIPGVIPTSLEQGVLKGFSIQSCRTYTEVVQLAAGRMIPAPDRGYSQADLPRQNAFSSLQGHMEKTKEVKKGKIEYLTPLNASTGNVLMDIEDKRMLSQPPRQKTPPDQEGLGKYFQYHKDHGHDRDDYRNLKIEIENLIKRGQLKEYVHKKTQNMNKRFHRGRLESPRALDGCMQNGIFMQSRDGACPVFPGLSYSMKDFEGNECPHEDPLVITPVVTNFEVGRIVVDTGRCVDILFVDACLKLGMSRVQIRPLATPLVGFIADAVSPLGVANLMVTMEKHR